MSDATETGISPTDRNEAAMRLADRKPSLLAIRQDDLIGPRLSAERALELSAHIQTLARDLAGPYPFQADYYNEVLRLARGALLDDALAFFAADQALESSLGDALPSGGATPTGDESAASDLRRRAYTFWANDFDKVVRVGRFFADAPATWPEAL